MAEIALAGRRIERICAKRRPHKKTKKASQN